MTNSKTTKRALVSSVIALVICFAMLLGTTYAWFTDSVTSSGNKIVAGNLDVELYKWTGTGENDKINITESADPIFSGATIWEPGRTEVAYLSIKNAGSLDLKYRVAVEVKDITSNKLLEVMTYAITPDATFGTVDLDVWKTAEQKYLNPIDVNYVTVVANDATLLDGEEHFFALSIHMDELAGNEFMNQSVTFDIKVLAGQLASEEDSFGPNYDKLAVYPMSGSAAPIPEGGTAAEIRLYDKDSKYKVGSIVIPADAAAPENTGFSAAITESTYENPAIEINAGDTVVKYDIKIEGLKENNDVPVKVQLKIESGINPDAVKLYHYGEEIACSYNPNTGYITFESATFSPFTVVYDADDKYVAPDVTGMARPTATVTYAPEYVGEGKVQWGSYGQWSPTEGLDSALEAAFIFACPDYENATDEDKAVIDAYRYWYCDFYLSLDRDLGENQIFLGGYYESFGAYVGFHNGDVTLAAGEELALLGSVTNNPWTYDDVEQYVAEFMCGVGDVNDALDGATFTVKLRLTNPENEAEFYDVNVVTYTFGGSYTVE